MSRGLAHASKAAWGRVRRAQQAYRRARAPKAALPWIGREAQRDAQIRRRHAEGESMAALGREYGISRERIRQIVNGK